MVDSGMITSLVEETNRYAEQTLGGKELSPHSKFRQWIEVTVGEMRAFLGLIVAMGLLVIGNRENIVVCMICTGYHSSLSWQTETY
ncbi:PiggyBac transposable element-derived protein 4 [Plakobranchus ocellatus]|uniref:PiggyBac transposable element-derived protein 4 n=1 Tax=Plakobranchus ocellatus TaxID=259542 RepID=A0AAV4BIN8_9GAST|nr:PiggyBac transposable element-derived protein 4 [Plakobranchus ocellatus]